MVAGIAEEMGKGFEGVVEGAPEVGPGTEAPVVLAGEDGVAGRGAGWRRNVGVVKEGALGGDGIEGRGLHHIVVGVGGSVGPTPVIGDAEQDVGWAFGGGTLSERGEKREEAYDKG